MPQEPQRPSRRPTNADLEAARCRRLRDVIAPRLDVLFCGINPGLYSAATGHHFARPGNRFWIALHRGGFTDRVLSAFEDRRLLEYGCGVTNLVARATAAASELSDPELRAGAKKLERKVRRYAPRWVAFVGIGAYRTAFGDTSARIGPQDRRIGAARIWALPNTSGLNAHFTAAGFAELFSQFHRALRRPDE